MKLKSLHYEIQQQAYSKSWHGARYQFSSIFYRIAGDIEQRIWPIISQIIVDRGAILLYTTNIQTQQRGNTND
jgi:hypothetical protein